MQKEVMKLLESKQYLELRKRLEKMNSADIAFLLGELATEEILILYRLLPKDKAIETFSYMESDSQETLIKGFTDTELKEVIELLNLDDAVDLIEEMPAKVVKRILSNANQEMRYLINEFLKYPVDSAGSIMTIEFIDLKATMTVNDAFDRIRKVGINRETIYTCYVLDDSRKLIGIVSVKNLLLSKKDALIKDIMETNIIYVSTFEDQEEVAKKFNKYDFIALPVVDQETRLVGIITIDDAMDVLEEEHTEDLAKMAAMSPTEDSYFKTSVWQHAKHRILWLLVLMLSATVTGIIITKYEDAFATIPILVAFIPMLMDTGGNCGSQSSTIVIRGMALDEIKMKDFFKVVWKEARIAVLVGIVLAVVNGIRVAIQYQNVTLAVVVGLSLIGTIMLSKLLGCMLPMIAKRFKLDPAIMAAPLITTIVDTCSILIYFNIAMRLLHL